MDHFDRIDREITRRFRMKKIGGLIFLAIYSVASIGLILLRVIPEEKIPYQFLNVWSGQAWYTVAVAVIP